MKTLILIAVAALSLSTHLSAHISAVAESNLLQPVALHTKARGFVADTAKVYLSNSEYQTNKNGPTTYDDCLLHEDYEGVHFEVTEITPIVNYPTSEFFLKHPSLLKNLATFVYKKEGLDFDQDPSYLLT